MGITSGWRRFLAGQSFITIGVFVLLAAILMGLPTTRHGRLATEEIIARQGSHNLQSILKNPVNAPHKIVEFGLQSAGFHGSGLRISSIVFAAAFAGLFYVAAKSLFGKAIGVFGTILFAATPLLLTTARLASPTIMLFMPIALMAVYIWMLRAQTDKDIAFMLLVITAGLSLYIPGLLWLIAGAVIVGRKKLALVIYKLSKPAAAAAFLLALLIVAPLIYALIRDWALIKSLALLPSAWPAPLTALRQVGWMASALFVKTPYATNVILARLPVLGIIQIALLLFGAYAFWAAAKTKALALVSWVVFVIIAAGLNYNLRLLALALPAIGILIAAGLRYLYIEWRGVFPRNPLAKSLALGLIMTLVLVHLLFGARYSLVALPHAAPAKAPSVVK